tara:strand:- start:474 stop:887 length:414 start_codon:yes stop_codon:yes gene_type:complete
MKWEITDTKTNIATSKTTNYKLSLDTDRNSDILTVTVTVNKKPLKAKPVNWNNSEIKDMVAAKGFKIVKTLSKNSLNNETANSKVYTYELEPKKTKTTNLEFSDTEPSSKRKSSSRRKPQTRNQESVVIDSDETETI